MEYEIKFKIRCGEYTCAESPGKFCRFLKWRMNNTQYCWIFGETLFEEKGWVRRCRPCLEKSTPIEPAKEMN